MNSQKAVKVIIVTGPTASGKTRMAVQLAEAFQGEIISADSRQVYRKMDIGTGKDLEEYQINDQIIPHHLIDIKEAGERYNVSDFQKDFLQVLKTIHEKGKLAILCGGTGLYIQSILENYELTHVPKDDAFRERLQALNQEELLVKLDSMPYPGNFVDRQHRKRTIRALEVAHNYKKYPQEKKESNYPLIESLVVGIDYKIYQDEGKEAKQDQQKEFSRKGFSVKKTPSLQM